MINYLFLRISNPVKSINFNFNLDENLPSVPVNEFVVWEIVEPLIQNAIDHSGRDVLEITIITKYNKDEHTSLFIIEDNGKGIRQDLLEKDDFGVKRIFLENISTKEEDKNTGYGCYLAYEISKRCGWKIDAENSQDGGARFTLFLQH